MDPRRSAPSPSPDETFEDFKASALFCSRCRAPRPVRERLLLVLPDGELWDYLCAACGASVGSRRLSAPQQGLVLP